MDLKILKSPQGRYDLQGEQLLNKDQERSCYYGRICRFAHALCSLRRMIALIASYYPNGKAEKEGFYQGRKDIQKGDGIEHLDKIGGKTGHLPAMNV